MDFVNYLEVFFSKHFPDKSYIVGGWCRDKLLNKNPKDIDIVIEEENGAERACILLSELDNVSYYKVGNSYPIYKVYFKEYNETIDIADSQKEYFPDTNSRQRLTKYASLREDSLRRDFTINKIYYNLTTKKYLSFCNGIKDLENKIITCDNNPNKMFSNDPLRIIRMCRFSIKYDFTIDDYILQSAYSNIDRLNIISKERIQEELIKICNCSKGLYKFLINFESIFLYIFPWYENLQNILQHPSLTINDIRNIHLEGKYVSDHIKLCLYNMPDDYKGIIQLAILFHDIGKLKTRSIKDNKCRFINHENVGVYLAEEELSKLKFSNKDIKTICMCIKYHMRLHEYNLKTDKSVRKLIREVNEYLDIILKVSEIDKLSCIKEKQESDFNILKDKIYNIKNNMKEPLISGDDIINIYNESPSEIIGLVKKACLDLQDNYNFNKDKLIIFLKQYKHSQDFLSKYKKDVDKINI